MAHGFSRDDLSFSIDPPGACRTAVCVRNLDWGAPDPVIAGVGSMCGKRNAKCVREARRA